MQKIQTSTHQQPPLELKVFQASPLAVGNTPIPFLDLDEEEECLKEALKDTNIKVSFEIATVHGLSDFLGQKKSFLHLSCHGHPKQLFIEDGFGGCHTLTVGENLERWIKAGDQSLKFVFVSACHSRSAGEAFLDAGVPHVVCCEQDGHQLLDQAARIFARDFYTAVANGNTLEQAYEFGIVAVLQSPEIKRVAGVNPELEAAKFVLLTRTEGDIQNTPATTQIRLPIVEEIIHQEVEIADQDQDEEQDVTAMTSFQRHSAHLNRKLLKGAARRLQKSPSSGSMYMLPVPPQPFLERELDMYQILTAFFRGNAKVRLVRVAGDKGIGKESLAKAIAQYAKKRFMWGQVLWLPPLQRDMDNSSAIRQYILQNYQEEKALLIIDASQYSDGSMSCLCSFLDDVFELTKKLKVILIHGATTHGSTTIRSKRAAGFPCFEETIRLMPLSFESTAFLFCHSCRHVTKWHATNKILLRNMKRDANVWKVLGEGNPARILLMAKNIEEMEFETLTGRIGPIRIEDFEQRLNYVAQTMFADDNLPEANSHPETPQAGLKYVVVKDSEAQSTPPPLRTQEEIIDRFLPILKNKEVYRKTVPSFIRKASRGEHVVTVINGVPATENTVNDDNSWLVCGQVANEYYPLSDKKFKAIYDTENPKPILVSHANPQHAFLRTKGFQTYRSKRRVWAHKVDESDMSFFRHSSPAASNDSPSAITNEAYFMAPWGKPNRIELHDYLVLSYPDGEDDIYRIERTLFERSYADTNQAATGGADNLRERTAAVEESMIRYRECHPDFASLEEAIRLQLQALMSAVDRAAEQDNRPDEWNE